jgi:hypothetical protein
LFFSFPGGKEREREREREAKMSVSATPSADAFLRAAPDHGPCAPVERRLRSPAYGKTATYWLVQGKPNRRLDPRTGVAEELPFPHPGFGTHYVAVENACGFVRAEGRLFGPEPSPGVVCFKSLADAVRVHAYVRCALRESEDACYEPAPEGP